MPQAPLVGEARAGQGAPWAQGIFWTLGTEPVGGRGNTVFPKTSQRLSCSAQVWEANTSGPWCLRVTHLCGFSRRCFSSAPRGRCTNRVDGFWLLQEVEATLLAFGGSSPGKQGIQQCLGTCTQ